MTQLIGITGGIGSGKSVVSRILRLQGHCVYDCDHTAKILMEQNYSLKQAIAQRLGNECITSDGMLNRAEIARHVFSDGDKLRWLNSMVHAIVVDDVRLWRESSGSQNVFVESAILNSSGLSKICDEIWLVDAPVDVRIERATRRDYSSMGDVKKRVNAQKDEYSCFPTHIPLRVIRNYGDESLLEQINALLSPDDGIRD